jgi:hypothetical protein
MGIFVIGTIWFWILLGVSAGLILFFLERPLGGFRDDGGGAESTAVILVAFVLYWFLGSSQDILDLAIYVRDNAWHVISMIAFYFFIGVIWSIAKWYFFLMNIKDGLLAKVEYDKQNKLTTRGKDWIKDQIPQAKNNKNRITTWMSYWPFSMLWTLINEPIKKAFRYIYARIEGIFQKMSNHIFRDLTDDEK